jgi:hypothetical protein
MIRPLKNWPLIRALLRKRQVTTEPIICLTPWLDSLGQGAVMRSVYQNADGSVVTIEEDALGHRTIDPPGASVPGGEYQ